MVQELLLLLELLLKLRALVPGLLVQRILMWLLLMVMIIADWMVRVDKFFASIRNAESVLKHRFG